MYNLRYHIASLVAVFLALSVGLVLGSIVVERGTIDRQREALVKSLQTDFARINSENKELSTRVSANEEFENALVAGITSGLLADKTLLLVANTGRTDGLSSAVRAIENAGGKTAVVMLQGEGLKLDEGEVSKAAQLALGTSDTGEALLKSVVASLSAEWAGVGERPLTEALEDAGAVNVDDLPVGTPVDGIVFLDNWDGRVDPATLTLATAARELGQVVVGARGAASTSEVAETFAGEGLSAVNDLGTPRGEYSLAALLAGRASGYYGEGSSTDGPFPTLAPLPRD